ncbi:ferredoxin-thioredoxin reductase, variable chain-like [Phalaenopsis equestris]|uniref:ferredoxin-thioredoxin reductase, variable chain-like n=1 Tax=Phalaenopsis equestris TaxID=78828 RepID=UPI0009E2786C|nr:ferredoxin-thioredoxin reductase, variable chain-like [Phalaenopsis equestris]
MPIASSSPSSSAHAASIFRRPRSLYLPATALPRSFLPPPPPPGIKRSLSYKPTLTADLSPEAMVAAGKIGVRIRVKAPVKVCHVAKAPGVELQGMEGVIKQYVGLYKGKRISATLPFKIEFIWPVHGHEKPIKFFAHLREDEFEFL